MTNHGPDSPGFHMTNRVWVTPSRHRSRYVPRSQIPATQIRASHECARHVQGLCHSRSFPDARALNVHHLSFDVHPITRAYCTRHGSSHDASSLCRRCRLKHNRRTISSGLLREARHLKAHEVLSVCLTRYVQATGYGLDKSVSCCPLQGLYLPPEMIPRQTVRAPAVADHCQVGHATLPLRQTPIEHMGTCTEI